MSTNCQEQAASLGATQRQMVLPLLEHLDEAGGAAPTREIYEAVAQKTQVPAELRHARARVGRIGQTVNLFERNVRWAQQVAKRDGLVARAGADVWEITAKGKKALTKATPWLVITIFTTPRGTALWGSCSDAVALIDDASIALLLTSPPYPLMRQKDYGNVSEREYVEWFLRIAEKWPRKLARDGSIVLNLGDTWLPGAPHQSLYQERLLLRLNDDLGLKLCQRFAWFNPAKLPAPAEWVTVRRVRVRPSLESIFWLSSSDQPKANNRNVLVPYSASMQRLLAQGGERRARRPSGYLMRNGGFASDHGGAIPHNLIVAPNTESCSAYIDGCRVGGLPIHGARFPEALPEFFIRMCTDEGDLVYDPFAGSGTTAAVAERLGRRWITSEIMREYVIGQSIRFPHARFDAQNDRCP